MRFVVLVKATPEAEAGKLPTPEQLTEMGKFNEELAKAGVLLALDGLRPTSQGARLRFSGGKATVTDGPFTESKELVAGFWIVQGKSKAEVVERFKHAPMEEGQEIEVRQVYEQDDLAENVTPESAERWKRVQEAIS